MARALFVLALVTLLGCGDSRQESPPRPPPPPSPAFACGGSDVEVKAEGILISQGCPRAAIRLMPRVDVGGVWIDGSECDAIDARLDCRAGDVGRVEATLDGDRVRVRFTAARDVVLDGLALEGEARIEGATSWLSNGFQSWSQSGVIAIGSDPGDEALATALGQRADAEVLRDGSAMSWTFTHVGGGGPVLLAGAVSAARWRPWTQVFATGNEDILHVRLVSGGTGEQVALPRGEGVVEAEPFFVGVSDAPAGSSGASELADLQRRYAAAIHAWRDDDPTPARAEIGWNSWYELFEHVDETAVRENASRVREVLGPLRPDDRPLRIVIDDGWERAWGEWEPNDRFPSGLDGLARDLGAAGFTVGVWLAPLLVDADSAIVTEHPEWLVAGASYEHSLDGTMKVLDVTQPGVAAHLQEVVRRLVGWGLTLLKIDFLFAGALDGTRASDVTPMQAYAEALRLIREAAGDGVVLLAVGAPDVASIPYVDAWRIGGDIALEPFGPSWPFLPSQVRSITARGFLCSRVLCDADPPLLRTMPQDEVGTGGWIAALAGGALLLSDDLRTLDPSRVPWGVDAQRTALALGGAAALPEDPYPPAPPESLVSAITDQFRQHHASSHVVPGVWRFPDGTRIGMNAGEDPITLEGIEIPPRGTRLLP